MWDGIYTLAIAEPWLLPAGLVCVGMAGAWGLAWLRLREWRRLEPKTDHPPEASHMAKIAHELRTPLNGVLGVTHLLSETDIDPEQAAHLDQIRMSGEAMLALTEQLLDGARMEAGKFSKIEDAFDPLFLAESVVELLNPKALAKKLTIAATASATVPATVNGDAGRFRQILINLAGNALKFTMEGSVGIALDYREGMLLVAVEDTGPGLSEDAEMRLFKAFEQLGSKAAAKEGAGLGLSITRDIVAALGGSIRIESLEGKGTTFHVDLPWHGEAPRTEPESARQSILIAAPNSLQRRYLQARLADQGAQVTTTGSVAAALNLLVKNNVQTILIDAEFDGQGFELAQAAAVAGIEKRILLLSNADRRAGISSRNSAFTGFLMKPVRRRSLLERVLPDANVGQDLSAQSSSSRPPPPLIGAPRSTKADISTGAQQQSLNLTGVSVAIVEDDPVSATLLQRQLEKLGAVTTVFASGKPFLDSLPEAAIVFLDHDLPDMSGLDIAAGLKARGRRPILVSCSASIDPETLKRLAHAGFDAHLKKPFTAEMLAALPWPPKRQKVA
jgi:CheY-like chemotaxis protein